MKHRTPAPDTSDKLPFRERIDWLEVRHNMYAAVGVVATVVTLYGVVQHPQETLQKLDSFSSHVTAPAARWIAEIAVGSD